MRIARLKNVNSFQGRDQSSGKSDRVNVFKKFIKSGPCFICIVCNRCLYRKSIVKLSENKHKELINNMFHFIPSHDSSFYICKTCAQQLNKNQIPCQAVCNKPQIYDFSIELRCIHRLERVLIARKLQFKKVTIMPKGQSPKFKGAICNVSIDVASTCNTSTRPADSNALVIVKLKRKLEYRGHVYFEPVCQILTLRILQSIEYYNP